MVCGLYYTNHIITHQDFVFVFLLTSQDCWLQRLCIVYSVVYSKNKHQYFYEFCMASHIFIAEVS